MEGEGAGEGCKGRVPAWSLESLKAVRLTCALAAHPAHSILAIVSPSASWIWRAHLPCPPFVPGF